MRTIEANGYRATTAAVREAIDESKLQNTIVRIVASGHVLEAVRRELEAECEGSAVATEEQEFWGVDCDGAEWRVHLVTRDD